jgi:hypothetical protein
MANQLVPVTTRVRPSRVHNIDTDRLQRRLEYLTANRDGLAYACDGRKALRELAHEILAIEAELSARL